MPQILAPNDDAFDSLLRSLGGGKRLPLDQFYALPELRDILKYHVLPGYYTSGAFWDRVARDHHRRTPCTQAGNERT